MSVQKIPTTKITVGGKVIELGKVGHGLMMMTWKPTPVPDEECFESIKASLDMVPDGAKMLLNSGEFYGVNPREANLELIARFFNENPGYKEKAFLSIKGGSARDTLMPHQTDENLRASVDCCNEKLRDTVKMDLFECARVDPARPVEEVIGTLSQLVKEGKFDFIGMSECKAETIRKGHAVHPIAIVEIEISPWSYEEETKKVVDTCAELGIAIAAYSPLGRGFLAGKFQTLDDLEDGDMRKHMSRYGPSVLENNKAIADGLKEIAVKRGITPAQLCIAWVASLGDHVIPIPGSSGKNRTLENTSAALIQLTAEDKAAIQDVLDKHPVQGGRYGDNEKIFHLWG